MITFGVQTLCKKLQYLGGFSDWLVFGCLELNLLMVGYFDLDDYLYVVLTF